MLKQQIRVSTKQIKPDCEGFQWIFQAVASLFWSGLRQIPSAKQTSNKKDACKSSLLLLFLQLPVAFLTPAWTGKGFRGVCGQSAAQNPKSDYISSLKTLCCQIQRKSIFSRLLFGGPSLLFMSASMMWSTKIPRPWRRLIARHFQAPEASCGEESIQDTDQFLRERADSPEHNATQLQDSGRGVTPHFFPRCCSHLTRSCVQHVAGYFSQTDKLRSAEEETRGIKDWTSWVDVRRYWEMFCSVVVPVLHQQGLRCWSGHHQNHLSDLKSINCFIKLY